MLLLEEYLKADQMKGHHKTDVQTQVCCKAKTVALCESCEIDEK